MILKSIGKYKEYLQLKKIFLLIRQVKFGSLKFKWWDFIQFNKYILICSIISWKWNYRVSCLNNSCFWIHQPQLVICFTYLLKCITWSNWEGRDRLLDLTWWLKKPLKNPWDLWYSLTIIKSDRYLISPYIIKTAVNHVNQLIMEKWKTKREKQTHHCSSFW